MYVCAIKPQPRIMLRFFAEPQNDIEVDAGVIRAISGGRRNHGAGVLLDLSVQ
jgi:hypothetical protein